MAKKSPTASVKKVIFDSTLLMGAEEVIESRPSSAKARLSLDPATPWGHVEDAFFERGAAEEREYLALYASLPAGAKAEPRRLPLRRTHLLVAGIAVVAAIGSTVVRMAWKSSSEPVAQVEQVAPVVPSAPIPTPAPATAQAVPAAAPAPSEQPGVPATAEPSAAQPPTVAEANAIAPVPVVAEAKEAVPTPTATEAKEVVPAPAVAEAKAAEPVKTVVEAKAAEPVKTVVEAKAAVPAPTVAPSEAPSSPSVNALVAKPIVAAEPDGVAACREGLEKRQSRVINEACASALTQDKTLAAPLLKWTRGEFERGRTGIASTWASRIIAADPEQADAYVIIGVAEQTAKRIPAARTAYKRYLELAPRGAFARDVRSALATM